MFPKELKGLLIILVLGTRYVVYTNYNFWFEGGGMENVIEIA